jgi:hypothetical protein
MPFKSKAQQRFMFAAEERGDLPKGTAERWAKETPDIKKLPEHKKKACLKMAADLGKLHALHEAKFDKMSMSAALGESVAQAGNAVRKASGLSRFLARTLGAGTAIAAIGGAGYLLNNILNNSEKPTPSGSIPVQLPSFTDQLRNRLQAIPDSALLDMMSQGIPRSALIEMMYQPNQPIIDVPVPQQ